jgi:hypothetical protein
MVKKIRASPQHVRGISREKLLAINRVTPYASWLRVVMKSKEKPFNK